jgi:hypothetical protein
MAIGPQRTPKRDSATEAEVGLTEPAASAGAAQGALPPDYFPRRMDDPEGDVTAAVPPRWHDIRGPRPSPALTSAHPEHRTARTAGSQDPGLLSLYGRRTGEAAKGNLLREDTRRLVQLASEGE